MNKKAYPLRIPSGLLELAELKSKEERTDKATALRQWLYGGAEEYVLGLLSAGRLTLSRAAELLELSVYDVQRLAQERGIELGATAEQYEKARQTARELGSIKASRS
jgi:predicted HTH domain antitoxin